MNIASSLQRNAFLGFAVTVSVLSCGSFVEAQQELKFEPQIVIRKPFPAIVEPKSVSAERAERVLHSKELVLGVEIDGVSRAYPINMLTGPQREIINDKLGDKAIAATW